VENEERKKTNWEKINVVLLHNKRLESKEFFPQDKCRICKAVVNLIPWFSLVSKQFKIPKKLETENEKIAKTKRRE
jgi:hypothetical protein